MKSMLLQAATAISLSIFLTGTSLSQSNPIWYVGKYEGKVGEQRFIVECDADLSCKFNSRENPSGPVSERPVKKATLVPDLKIVNGNLLGTRSRVSSNSYLNLSADEATLLSEIKPLIAASTSFSTCLDVGPEGSPMMPMIALCGVPNADSALDRYLALITMKSSCGNGAFCAYYFVPLKNVKSD